MSQSAGIRRGHTAETDPTRAAAQLHHQLQQPDIAVVILFCSPSLDLDRLGQEIKSRFGDCPVVGCTTAGELSEDGYRQGTVTGISLGDGHFHCVIKLLTSLKAISVMGGRDVVRDTLNTLSQREPHLKLSQMFAFLLIDGMSTQEETVVSYLHQSLGEIPLFGGSAGDDMNFGQAYVFHEGRFLRDAAVLLLIGTERPFRVFKSQNFVATDVKMVVTEADPLRRVVSEINGEPAAEEYARLVGLQGEPLTPMIFAAHPVVVRIGGDYYVRSIQKVNEDGSLTFFCAIDEGIVLTVAHGEDLIETLRRQFEALEDEIGDLDLIIGCDCMLRRLELEQRQGLRDVVPLFAAHNVIGFNTYGEQFKAMHVNQTFTGVAIGGGN